MTTPIARRGDGLAINPGDAVVPILHEVGFKQLKVVGTGFYLTRYGLVVTAKHVVEDMVAEDGKSLGVGYVVHLNGDTEIFFRHIKRAHLLIKADVAVLQADNYVDKFPDRALMNLRPDICTHFPAEGGLKGSWAKGVVVIYF